MEQIKSIREQVGAQFFRPSMETLNSYIEALNEAALKYLQVERGLSMETIEHFKLGYDPKRNAIAIPTFKRGELIRIKYRFLEGEKKYEDTHKTENWIFNEDGISDGLTKGGILIVEGEFDLMSAYQSGLKNVVSPASGKDSFGAWVEYLDSIPKIYIAYDNDDGGREASLKMSKRLGIDKCSEVFYPDGIKDANEFFKKHTKEEFRDLIKSARPFYAHQFKGVGDVLMGLRNNVSETIQLEHVPGVLFEKDWMTIISGVSNVGKTSYVLNLVDELTRRNIPTLVFPFERGIESVGKRFLQVKFNKTSSGFSEQTSSEWDRMVDECVETPAYFSMPKKEDMVETIVKSKRIFDTKVVVIDHLDYIIRHSSGNKEAEIANTLQSLKRVAEENQIILLIVTHTRKIESPGGWKDTKRKPGIEDLKGSSSLYQDPEVVVMLSSDVPGQIFVDVLKNKGSMESATYSFDVATGKIKERILDAFDVLTQK